MILYSHQTGPLVVYDSGMLKTANLNPHVVTGWRMTRMEMLWFAIRCLRAALRL